MSVLDTSIPPGNYDISSVTVTDGSGSSVSVTFRGNISWSYGRGEWVEATNGGHHASTPVAMKVRDGNCKISLSGKPTSFLGSSNTHILEALTRTGNAASWTTTGAGTQHMFSLAVTIDTSAATGGGSQTLTWAYCLLDADGLSVDAPEGDLLGFTAAITALQEKPTIS